MNSKRISWLYSNGAKVKFRFDSLIFPGSIKVYMFHLPWENDHLMLGCVRFRSVFLACQSSNKIVEMGYLSKLTERSVTSRYLGRSQQYCSLRFKQ